MEKKKKKIFKKIFFSLMARPFPPPPPLLMARPLVEDYFLRLPSLNEGILNHFQYVHIYTLSTE